MAHPSKYHVSMLRRVLVSAHGLLDAFLGISYIDMLALSPHVYGSRVIYAIVLLLKMHKANAAVVGNFIHTDELRVAEYLTKLAVISHRLLETDKRSALSRAFLVIDQLKQWLDMHENDTVPLVVQNEALGDLGSRSGKENLGSVLQEATGLTTRSRALGAKPACSGQSGFRDGRLEQTVPSTIAPYDLHCENGRNDEWFWEDFFNVEMLK